MLLGQQHVLTRHSLLATHYSPRTTYYSHYQERMLLGHPANSTFFMQPGGKLAMHVQDGSPLTTEVHEGG